MEILSFLFLMTFTCERNLAARASGVFLKSIRWRREEHKFFLLGFMAETCGYLADDVKGYGDELDFQLGMMGDYMLAVEVGTW